MQDQIQPRNYQIQSPYKDIQYFVIGQTSYKQNLDDRPELKFMREKIELLQGEKCLRKEVDQNGNQFKGNKLMLQILIYSTENSHIQPINIDESYLMQEQITNMGGQQYIFISSNHRAPHNRSISFYKNTQIIFESIQKQNEQIQTDNKRRQQQNQQQLKDYLIQKYIFNNPPFSTQYNQNYRILYQFFQNNELDNEKQKSYQEYAAYFQKLRLKKQKSLQFNFNNDLYNLFLIITYVILIIQWEQQGFANLQYVINQLRNVVGFPNKLEQVLSYFNIQDNPNISYQDQRQQILKNIKINNQKQIGIHVPKYITKVKVIGNDVWEHPNKKDIQIYIKQSHDTGYQHHSEGILYCLDYKRLINDILNKVRYLNDYKIMTIAYSTNYTCAGCGHKYEHFRNMLSIVSLLLNKMQLQRRLYQNLIFVACSKSQKERDKIRQIVNILNRQLTIFKHRFQIKNGNIQMNAILPFSQQPNNLRSIYHLQTLDRSKNQKGEQQIRPGIRRTCYFSCENNKYAKIRIKRVHAQ